MSLAETRICLNMIVKNESKIIVRLLDSLTQIIDSYCICDTGSTDNTVELIEQFFSRRSIPGKIVKEPFRDFGYNRTFSLTACEQYLADAFPSVPYHILLMDADMVFWINPNLSPANFKRGLTADAYHVFQGTDAFYYKNTRIVRAGLGATYWGVTHEYVSTPEHTKFAEIAKDAAFIRDIGDGGAKADKFERDIRLLKQGLVDHPDNDRYTFYLANSYRDNGDLDLAIETYTKRAALGGWFEEVWMSMYQIGICYQRKGDMTAAIHWWLEAYQVFPKRLENLYEIIHHYRNAGKNQLAYLFYAMAVKQLVLNPDPNYLFTKKDVYAYKLDYEFSIIGYYCNVDGFDMTRICTKVLNCALADQGAINNVMSNYKFYAPALTKRAELTVPIPPKMAEGLQSVAEGLQSVAQGIILTDPLTDTSSFSGSTPSLVAFRCAETGANRVAVCVRFVNYKINDKGGYENQDLIVTKNSVAIFDADNWTKVSEFELAYDESIDNVYVGLEDVRLFAHKGELLYNANRGLDRGRIIVEHGRVHGQRVYGQREQEIGSQDHKYHHLVMPSKAHRKSVEKNWVFFEDALGNKKVIYGWRNLSIGDLVASTSADEPGLLHFEQTHSIDMPRIFDLARGSTNGVRVGDEIWFIVHTVSYEDRRYYYHMFVAIDATTYALIKYTPMFTFEGEKIEYTLGFFHSETDDAFYVGYSTMDCTTKYVGFNRSAIEDLMHNVI